MVLLVNRDKTVLVLLIGILLLFAICGCRHLKDICALDNDKSNVDNWDVKMEIIGYLSS